ncbi:Hint domain-containing protein [Profundibacter amoris]|uniref:Hedgehog/Intein (Hint) domain-containing protein n=1 Tax=Profundibacter amoris TaxID=2171755 RepID=A0A347UID0_9RHOB|nr:Hint domain-containing protein [Profundibacter amoris]AXX98608.1 hypothetical protein BAR1_12155 [Profundibacter amoris]
MTTTFYARGDSSTANNASLNAENTSTTPVTTLEFVATDGGDIILEYNGGAEDSDTVVLVDGVEMTFTVEFSGTLPYTNKLSDVNGEDLRGTEIMVITTSDGQRYFFGTDGTLSVATMEDFPNGAHSIENVDDTTDILICFAGGTFIETPDGQIKVEDLRVGGAVNTYSGIQTLRWIGVRSIFAKELQAKPHFRPVVISKDALGAGLPSSDLLVSPNHRVLLSGWQMELNFATDSMLCAAKYLVNGTTIVTDMKTSEVKYYHLMFDNHEIVLSNGLPSESLLPCGLTAKVGQSAAEYEFKEIFGVKSFDPVNKKKSVYPALKCHEAKLMHSIKKYSLS